ncbi:MAG: phosphoribosylaminoimidazolesuccinocarboxamide synthase [Chloroflexi bacterium]|nr:phosphoribosylaminoimidazolesuccinocarboxamide synthase [Chloroflexota bacterium]
MGDGLMLMVATDRISAFDVVLPNGIPDKGYVLSRMSKFWFEMTQDIIPNHFVGLADDPEALGALADHPRIKTLPPEIARQAMVVKRAERVDVECVVRAYLTGSGLLDYKATGTIFGIEVPVGLVDGSKLPELLFTPTTKAETGHDEPLSMAAVARIAGAEMAERLRKESFAVFLRAHEYAAERGIIIADTKFEFGMHDGELILIDEVLTPDSSRFWDAKGYAPGKSQPNFDKQFVRDWLLEQPWDRTPPAPALPDDIVAKTRERYLEAYERLTGRALL